MNSLQSNAANAAISIAGEDRVQRRYVAELNLTLERVKANQYEQKLDNKEDKDDKDDDDDDDEPTLEDDLHRINRLIRAILTQHSGPISQDDVAAVEAWLKSQRNEAKYCDASTIAAVARRVDETDIVIWQGDITALKIDSIVNAANERMLGCFTPFHACIDNVIHFQAGPRLRLACESMMENQPLEPIGKCRITPAYLLPSKFCLHTVGPDLRDFNGVVQPQLLASCYRSCLDEIVRHNETKSSADVASIRSIAFCGISTGVYCYPKRQACEVALTTVFEWLKNPQNKGKIDRIVFNTFDNESTKIYEQTLARNDEKFEFITINNETGMAEIK